MSSSKRTAMHHLLNRHRSWQKSFSLPPKIDGIIFCFLSYHIKMKNLLQIGENFHSASFLMWTEALLQSTLKTFMEAANCPKIQLVQILHKLRITGKPINTNSIRCPLLSPSATVLTPAGQHNFGNGQQRCWTPLQSRDMSWLTLPTDKSGGECQEMQLSHKTRIAFITVSHEIPAA